MNTKKEENKVKEEVVPNRPKMTWEEKLKAYNCITIDEFSEKIGESIKRLIPEP